MPFDERKCVQQQATCQVTIAGDGPAEVGSKSAGGAFGEEVTEAPPIMLLIRPQLPSLEAWRRNPAKAVYHLITLPIKLVLFPFYKVRIHTLTPYMTCPESDTAQAVAKEISVSGLSKQQRCMPAHPPAPHSHSFTVAHGPQSFHCVAPQSHGRWRHHQ